LKKKIIVNIKFEDKNIGLRKTNIAKKKNYHFNELYCILS
jgi:hypothetical protein